MTASASPTGIAERTAGTCSASPAAGKTHMVGISALVVVSAPDKLRTVLGSCVGIAIFDAEAGIAGLAHSILATGAEEAEELGKFADQAVDNLIIRLAAEGAETNRLRAKLIGGAAMFGKNSNNLLGDRNVESARQRLHAHGVAVVAEAIGGTKGRKMLLDPSTGEIEVAIIGEEAQII